MARIASPPPKLTKHLTQAIQDKIAAIGRGSKLDAPASPLDWVAVRAEVRRGTVVRWLRRAYTVRNNGYSGQVAKRWIAFADAVDHLCAISADVVVTSIQEIAEAEDKKSFDAWVYLDKRALRIDDAMTAADVEPSEETSVSHMSQELFDALTDDERDGMERDLAALQEIAARISAREDAAASRMNED